MKHGVDFVGVGVGAFIYDKDKVLLIHRKKDNVWSLPGGKIDLKERSETATVREIKEELGIDIKAESFLCNSETFDTMKDGTHWISIMHVCSLVNGVPKIVEPEKHTDAKWFKLDDLPENIFEPSRIGINHFIEKKKKAKEHFEELVEVGKRLRAEDGCPHDKDATYESIMDYVNEEIEELKQAVSKKDFKNMKEEIGDLIFNFIMLANIAEEEEKFNLKDVLDKVKKKIIERHEYVFGNNRKVTKEEAWKLYNEVKKRQKNEDSVCDKS